MGGDDEDEDATRPVLLPPLVPDVPSADLGASPSSPAVDAQRLQQPSAADAQRLQSHSQTAAQRLQSHSQTEAQRLGHEPSADAQRTQTSSADVHRGDPMQRSDAQRTFSRGKLRAIQHARPRMIVGIGVAAAATTLVIINTQRDDKPALVSPATVVTESPVPSTPANSVVVVTTAVPRTTAAPAATTAPATTALSTTTAVLDTTTTVLETTLPTTGAPAAVSSAGSYLVTFSDLVVTSAAVGAFPIPQQPSQSWSLAGPCDGVGECTMSFAAIAGSAGTNEVGTPDVVVLAPTGPGTYGGSRDIDLTADGCGTGAAVFAVTLGGGTLSGTYQADVSAGASCDGFTVTATYAGVFTA